MRSLLTLCLFLSVLTLSAQSVDWTQPLLSAERDGIWDVIADMDGNIYVTGFFEADITIDGTVVEHVGDQDFFLAKFDKDGNLIWVEGFTGVGFDRSNALAFDSAGNIILGGLYSGILNFFDTEIISAFGSIDILMVSISPDGDLNWYQSYGGDGSDICYGLSTSGNTLYAVGHFSSTVEFGGSFSTAAGGSDGFVLSLEADNGDFNWVEAIGGVSNDRLYSVTGTDDGGVVTVGYFENSFLLDGETFTSQAGRDQILVKLDLNSELQWGRVGMAPGEFDELWDVITDEQGNLYVSGFFSDSLVIAGQTLYASAENQYNACIYALDNNGNFGWGYACNTPDGSFGSRLLRADNIIYQGFSMTNGTLYDGSEVTGLAMYAVGYASFSDTGTFMDVYYFDGPDNDYFGASTLVDGDLVIGLGFEQSIDLLGEMVPGSADQDVVVFRLDPESMTSTEEPDAKLFEEVAETRWNPVDQSLEIDLFDERIDWISLYTTDGRLLAQQPATTYNRIPLPNGSGGMVVVQLTGGGQVYAQMVSTVR